MSEIIEIGKALFNFHPDENFTSTRQVLEVAYKNIRNRQTYNMIASQYAERMAKYIDKQVDIETTTS